MLASGGDVRMAAGFDIGIDANRKAGKISWCAHRMARGLFEKNFEFSSGLDVELENAGVVGLFDFIAESFADFFAGFAYTGKDDAIAGNGNVGEVIEFTSRNDIEAAAAGR